jgi:formate hydrogenlyase subunit 3/multisubunit Na+/H+ antiporter MnhD subunit
MPASSHQKYYCTTVTFIYSIKNTTPSKIYITSFQMSSLTLLCFFFSTNVGTLSFFGHPGIEK